MKILLFFLLLPMFGYAQSEEARLLFLAINEKRSELKYRKLSYTDTKQTELDTRAVKIGIDDTAVPQYECDCLSENVFSADSFRELLRTAIDRAYAWHHLDQNERNAAISVVNLDGRYYAVIRTY